MSNPAQIGDWDDLATPANETDREEKMKTSSLPLLGAVALVFGAGLFGAAEARDPVRITALSSPFGSGAYEQAVIWERLIAERHPWLRLVAQETPGYVYNAREMAANPGRHAQQAFWTSTGLLWAARTGQEGFFPEPIDTDTYRSMVLRSTNCIWFATLDSEIKSIEDFSGRRVGLGRRSQTHWGLFTTRMIEVGAQVTDARLEYLGNDPALSAMLDGRVDVAVMLTTNTSDLSVVFPSGTTRQLEASGRTYYHVPVPKAVVDRVNDELEATFVSHTFPPNTVGNQPEPLECFGDFAFLAAHEAFPEDIAYEITNTHLDINVEAAKYIGAGKLYRREAMCNEPEGVTLHTGSRRACEEAGLF